MGVEEAKHQLEMAERELRGCEANLHRASRASLDAEAARTSNDLHYRLRRKHGNDYRENLKDHYDFALRQFNYAKEQLEKAKEDYRTATEA